MHDRVICSDYILDSNALHAMRGDTLFKYMLVLAHHMVVCTDILITGRKVTEGREHGYVTRMQRSSSWSMQGSLLLLLTTVFLCTCACSIFPLSTFLPITFLHHLSVFSLLPSVHPPTNDRRRRWPTLPGGGGEGGTVMIPTEVKGAAMTRLPCILVSVHP